MSAKQFSTTNAILRILGLEEYQNGIDQKVLFTELQTGTNPEIFDMSKPFFKQGAEPTESALDADKFDGTEAQRFKPTSLHTTLHIMEKDGKIEAIRREGKSHGKIYKLIQPKKNEVEAA